MMSVSPATGTGGAEPSFPSAQLSPLPRARRNRMVSAWSSSVCAVSTCVAPALAGSLGQQTVPRLARRLLYASRPACHRVQRTVRCGDAKRARKRLDGGASCLRFRPQAVIDGDGHQLRPARQRSAPARQQNQQRDRIRSARYGNQNRWKFGEVGKESSGFRVGDGLSALSTWHASVPARRSASRHWKRGDICARPRRAWRTPPPALRARQATGQAAPARPAPCRSTRTWSRC